MTIPERVEIDKKVHQLDPVTIAEELEFLYGTNNDEHLQFIEGYCKFYRYLPNYSKVIN